MRFIGYIIFLLIVLVGVTFAYLNAHAVIFNYYLGQQTLPLSLLLVVALGIGLLLGFIVMLIPLFKLRSKHSKLKKRLKILEKEKTAK